MQPNPGAGFQVIPIIFFFIVMYFLVMRPQQKKQKEHAKMLSELKKNDEIITSGGIHATIVNIKEDTFLVRIDENTRMEINKGAVAGRKIKAAKK
ncbi:MAG: preprotein translocase subunit YajC [Candidatus Omnitrophica bacterium]|nr:preprotein translocase subunit YajC [Candidatus Omnitrophota bacterium]